MSNQTTKCDAYIPRNPCLQGILKLLEDEESADIIFDVDGKEKLYAHRLILKGCAPELAEYCDSLKDPTSDQSPLSVPIKDTKPEIFRQLLRYVYGGNIPRDFLEKNSKDVIDTADRFGLGHLKVVAEAWYIKSTTITMDNFAEIFYFADTKKCALLKEKVMDFVIKNDTDALKRLSTEEVPQSQTMLTDVLTAVVRGKRKREHYEGNDPEKINLMSINTMRKKLDQRGLGVDGTREMLMDMLEKSVDVKKIVVAGAGIPEVNGIYVETLIGNDTAHYIMDTQYRGRAATAILFRMDNDNFWYSTFLGLTDETGERETPLFYRIKGNSDESIPPTGKCKMLPKGVVPAPAISFKAN